MCLNCAYSVDDKVSHSLECDVCLRNPDNVTKKFVAVKYRDVTLERPIDMFLSKEHKRIIDRELAMAYQSGENNARKTTPHPGGYFDYYPTYPDWHRRTFQTLKCGPFVQVSSTTLSTNSTLTLTWSVQVPTCVQEQVDVSELNISDSLGHVVEEKDYMKVDKTKVRCIDPEEVLKELDGVEVGNES